MYVSVSKHRILAVSLSGSTETSTIYRVGERVLITLAAC